MSYEESCNKFTELCQEVGVAEANCIFDNDPFAGCLYEGEGLYTEDEIAVFNHPCYGCEGSFDCDKCHVNER